MRHLAANLLAVFVEGLPEPLGVTDTHPFWSEDRRAFVPAGELTVGERLRPLDGPPARIVRITPHRGPPAMVFNLEIDAQHVYRVGNAGLLVHNAWSGWLNHRRDAASACNIGGRISITQT